MKPEVDFFFKKIDRVKPLVMWTNFFFKEKQKTEITKIRSESEAITINSIEMKRIVRKYSEQLYTKNSDNLDEMDKFLEAQNLPRLNHGELENLNNL